MSLGRADRRLSKSLKRSRRAHVALLKELVKVKRRVRRLHPEVVTAKDVAEAKEAIIDACDDVLLVGKQVLKASRFIGDVLDKRGH